MSTVAELIEGELKFKVTGGPKRFWEKRWFAVGLTAAECPSCKQHLHGYRKPYNPKPHITYHYWALACFDCKRLYEPAELDEYSRRLLGKFRDNQPALSDGAPKTHSKSSAIGRLSVPIKSFSTRQTPITETEFEKLKSELKDEPKEHPTEPVTSPVCWDKMDPSRMLSEKIITRLLREGILIEKIARHVFTKLAGGKMKAADWRNAMEQSDSEED